MGKRGEISDAVGGPDMVSGAVYVRRVEGSPDATLPTPAPHAAACGRDTDMGPDAVYVRRVAHSTESSGYGPASAPVMRAYWTTAEVAMRLGVDVDTVYELAATGGLPHIRVGRAYRFPIAQLEEWEARRLIVNDGPSAAQPRPARRSSRASRVGGSVFVPQPYTGPLAKRAA